MSRANRSPAWIASSKLDALLSASVRRSSGASFPTWAARVRYAAIHRPGCTLVLVEPASRHTVLSPGEPGLPVEQERIREVVQGDAQLLDDG